MSIHIPTDVEAEIRELVESGHFEREADVLRATMRLLQEEERLRWLRAAIEDGDASGNVDFSPELMDHLSLEAEDNARAGKPVKDAVKP
jgi:putative addiction module CopG family antidote